MTSLVDLCAQAGGNADERHVAVGIVVGSGLVLAAGTRRKYLGYTNSFGVGVHTEWCIG